MRWTWKPSSRGALLITASMLVLAVLAMCGAGVWTAQNSLVEQAFA